MANLSISAAMQLPGNTSCDVCHHDNQTYAYDSNSIPLLQRPIHGTLFMSICILVALLCICGNTLVLFVVYRNRPMHPRTTYMFLSNLAMADLFVGVFCVIPYMYHTMYYTWVLPHVMCRVFKFTEMSCLTVSVLILQTIALERFIAINYPLQAMRLFTRCKIRFAQILVWVIACLYSTPILFAYDAQVYHVNDTTLVYCHYSHEHAQMVEAYYLINFITWYILPMVIMTVLYCKIGMTLRHSQVTHHTMDLRLRCPSETREASGEAGDMGNSDPGGSRDDSRSTPVAQRTGNTYSGRVIVAKVKVWWRRRGTKYPNTARNIVREGCCSRVKRGSKGNVSKNENVRSTEEEQLAIQETSFTARTPPSTRIPRKFSFRNKQGQIRNGNIVCMESDRSSQGTPHTSAAGEIPTAGPAAQRRSDQNSHFPNSSTSTISRNGIVVPRCRRTSQISSRRRAIRLLVVIVCASAVLLLPIHLIKLMHMLKIPLGSFTDTIYWNIVSQLCLYLNSAVNPILYTFVSQSFRRNLRKALCSCCADSPTCTRVKRVPKPDLSSMPNTRNSSF